MTKEKAVVYADEDGVVKSNVKSRDSLNSSSILTTIVDQNYTRFVYPFVSTQLEN